MATPRHLFCIPIEKMARLAFLPKAAKPKNHYLPENVLLLDQEPKATKNHVANPHREYEQCTNEGK